MLHNLSLETYPPPRQRDMCADVGKCLNIITPTCCIIVIFITAERKGNLHNDAKNTVVETTPMMTLQQLANYMEVSELTVRRQIAEGQLKAYKWENLFASKRKTWMVYLRQSQVTADSEMQK